MSINDPAAPVIANFGGGVNSTAMIIEMVNRSEKIDAVLFADTGAEKPHTYTHIEAFCSWLTDRGYPAITTVKRVRRGECKSLEQVCFDSRTMPSIAYGYSRCSVEFKREPCDKWARGESIFSDWLESGRKIVKCIGYDASEVTRLTRAPRSDSEYLYRYPLEEWNIDRADCLDVIRTAGLCLPGKSACYFCPNSRAAEVLQLKRVYPELFARGLAIEAAALEDREKRGIVFSPKFKGLGRHYSWRDLAAADRLQMSMFDVVENDHPCACFDG